MANPRAQRVGDILVKAGVIDPLQLRSALAQHDAWGGRLAHVVVEMGLADEETVVECLARALGVQRVRVGNIQKDPQALSRVDVAFADAHAVFPIQLRDNGKVLLLAMADPSDLDTLDEVNRRTRARVTPYIAGEHEIRAAISRHYRGVQAPDAPRRSTTRSVPAAKNPLGEDEEEEFKLVDMSGNTVMKPLSELAPGLAQEALQAAAGTSTSDLLDDILGAQDATARLSEADLQRLETVRVNQEKSGKIVRAVIELLLEKGAISRATLQEKLKP
jgi:hypothetical protein